MMSICTIEPNSCGLSFYLDDLLDVENEVSADWVCKEESGISAEIIKI